MTAMLAWKAVVTPADLPDVDAHTTYTDVATEAAAILDLTSVAAVDLYASADGEHWRHSEHLTSDRVRWAVADTPAGLVIAHWHTTHEAASAEADRAMMSGLLGDTGLNVYVSLDAGERWHEVEHRDPPPPSWLPADLAEIAAGHMEVWPPAPTPAPTGTPRRGWWRRLRGESDWSPGRGCTRAALLLLICGPLLVLAGGYCAYELAASPACAALLLAWPRTTGGWNCPCGTYNSGFGLCRGCGRSRTS